jgi:hypothetical protein
MPVEMNLARRFWRKEAFLGLSVKRPDLARLFGGLAHAFERPLDRLEDCLCRNLRCQRLADLSQRPALHSQAENRRDLPLTFCLPRLTASAM